MPAAPERPAGVPRTTGMPAGYRPVRIDGFATIAPARWVRSTAGSTIWFRSGHMVLAIDGKDRAGTPAETVDAVARHLAKTLNGFHVEAMMPAARGGQQNRLIYQVLGYVYTVKGVRYGGVIAAFADPAAGPRTVGMIRFTDTRAHLREGLPVFDRAEQWAHTVS
jgi:hypothetical protein